MKLYERLLHQMNSMDWAAHELRFFRSSTKFYTGKLAGFKVEVGPNRTIINDVVLAEGGDARLLYDSVSAAVKNRQDADTDARLLVIERQVNFYYTGSHDG